MGDIWESGGTIFHGHCVGVLQYTVMCFICHCSLIHSLSI